MIYKIRKIVLPMLLILAFICSQFMLGEEKRENRVAQADLYTQTSESITNPDRGFYKSLAIVLTGNENGSALATASSLQNLLAQVDGCSLLHLRVDLAAFSSNGKYTVNSVTYTGTTRDIPALTLQSLAKTFEEIRKINATAIVRFSYNQNGLQNEDGYLNAEPDTSSAIPTIKTHISQLGEIISDYQDVISGIETGMIGPWGEQHSTKLAKIKDADALYYNLIEAWLSCGIDGVNFSVRRPLYYRYWANKKYALNLTDKDMSISDSVLQANPDLLRVGVFNDAYLGSSSDMGTYTNRAKETAWLNKAAQTVLFGGEVVVDTETEAIGSYNNAAYAIYEMQIVHTSYLNRNWNERVIGSQNGTDRTGSWETVAYSSLEEELTDYGVAYDPLYADKTAYDYIADHMGYRLVLQSASASLQNEKIKMAFSLKNVGFGNVVKEQKAQILFVRSGELKAYTTIDFDVREVKSNETKTYQTEVSVPSSLITNATYDVYLKIGSAFDSTLSDGVGTTLRTIAFANRDIYSSAWGANRLCSFSLEESAQIGSSVNYCQGSELTSSNSDQLSVSTDTTGISTVTVASNEGISAYVEKTLTEHTADAYPYIVISYECDVDFALSVYYDSGTNCINYKQSLPRGKHTVVYQTENAMNTLRLYVAHGQSGMADTEIKFYSVQLASHCVLGENATDGEKLVCYTDALGEAYGAEEILTVDSGSVFTPYSIRMQMNGVGIRLSGYEDTSGIRFGTLLNKTDYEDFVTTFGKENITTGILIVPTAYLKEIDGLSIATLEAYCEKKGVTLANIKNTGWNEEVSTAEEYGYYGSLVGLYQKNFDRAFTGIGYVTVKSQDKTFTVFADHENNSGSIREVANAVIADTPTYEALSNAKQALINKYAT